MEPRDDTAEASVPAVKSAARVLDLLEDIAVNGPASRAELSLRMGIPKSSIHAVLRTMTSRGWLELDRAGGDYRLGLRSLAVTSAYLASDPLVVRAGPLLDELVAITDETVHLARLDGTDVVYLDKRESSRRVPMASTLGRRVPAHCTSLGRAILATHPEAVRGALVPEDVAPLTPRATTDRAAVLAAIDRAARLGYAVETEETCVGVRCFGVALPVGGPAVNAVSIAVPLSRLDAARESLIIETLLRLGVRRPVRRRSPPLAR